MVRSLPGRIPDSESVCFPSADRAGPTDPNAANHRIGLGLLSAMPRLPNSPHFRRGSSGETYKA